MSDSNRRGSSTGHKGDVKDKHRREGKEKLQQLTDTIQSYEQQGAEMLEDRNRALLGEDTAKKAQKSAERGRASAQTLVARRNRTIARMKKERPLWTLFGAVLVGGVYLFGLRTAVGKGCADVIFDAWNYWTW